MFLCEALLLSVKRLDTVCSSGTRLHAFLPLVMMYAVTTLSGRDGSYLIVLPFERIDRSVNPPVRAFNRVLSVFAPRPDLAAALAAQGFLAGQPANVFGLTAAQRNARFLPRDFQLRDTGGTLHQQVGGQNPPVSVSVGMNVRLDIELLP